MSTWNLTPTLKTYLEVNGAEVLARLKARHQVSEVETTTATAPPVQEYPHSVFVNLLPKPYVSDGKEETPGSGQRLRQCLKQQHLIKDYVKVIPEPERPATPNRIVPLTTDLSRLVMRVADDVSASEDDKDNETSEEETQSPSFTRRYEEYIKKKISVDDPRFAKFIRVLRSRKAKRESKKRKVAQKK